MITYLEAIASPTHSIPPSDFYSGFAGEGVGTPYANHQTFYGFNLDVGGPGTGGPLFFTDYSFMGFDPHGLHDKYTNYFVNNRNQALINQAYCIHNPNHWKGYGADTWGITAVDGPEGYVAYEPTQSLDDGTIAPTGAISAIAYTPEESMAALRHFYRDLGAQVWSIYGFRDSFNQQRDWYSRDHDGPEPCAHGGDDRKLQNRSDLEELYGQSRDCSHVAGDWISCGKPYSMTGVGLFPRACVEKPSGRELMALCGVSGSRGVMNLC